MANPLLPYWTATGYYGAALMPSDGSHHTPRHLPWGRGSGGAHHLPWGRGSGGAHHLPWETGSGGAHHLPWGTGSGGAHHLPWGRGQAVPITPPPDMGGRGMARLLGMAE